MRPYGDDSTSVGDALSDPDDNTMVGAAAVLLEAELVLEGVVDRLDAAFESPWEAA